MAGAAPALERARSICAVGVVVAFVLWLGAILIGGGVGRARVERAAIFVGIVAWLVFAGSVARLEIASGSGAVVAAATFIIAASCPLSSGS